MVSQAGAYTGQVNASYLNNPFQNIYSLKGKADVLKQVGSVACLIESHRIVKNIQTGFYEFTYPLTLNQAFSLDPSTQFGNEISVGTGTAFLVGNKLMLTAAHCLLENNFTKWNFTKFSAVFGFYLQGHALAPLNEAFVCKITQIKACKYDVQGEDWALVELDKHPVGIKPLRIDFTTYVDHTISVHMLSHPLGLTMKYSEGVVVLPARDVGTFEADIPSFHGCSGAPIFSSTTNKVIGIHTRGHKSFDLADINKGTHNRLHVSTQEDLYEFGFKKFQRATSLLYPIASILDQNDGYYKKEAEKTFFIGKHYFSGEKTCRNYDRAVVCFYQTVGLDPTHAEAYCWLGRCYQYHKIDGKDETSRSYRLYKQALAITPHCTFHAEAFYYVGYCHHYGVGVEKDVKKTVEHYKEALKLDPCCAEAHEELLACYFEGVGVQNFEEAYEIFSKYAALGNVRAMHYLGECYYYGKGVAKDVKKALAMTNKAIGLGYITPSWVKEEEDKESMRMICRKIMSVFSWG